MPAFDAAIGDCGGATAGALHRGAGTRLPSAVVLGSVAVRADGRRPAKPMRCAEGTSVLPRETEVVIVGAGVSGLCTALFLARRGREVVVVDRGQPWSDASGANAGTISLQVKRPEVLDVTRLAIRLWETLSADCGSDLGFARPGGLRVATSTAEAAALRASVARQKAAGYEIAWLEGEALDVAAPWLGPEVCAASLCDWDSYSNPLLTGPALIAAARRTGAVVVGGAPVLAVVGAARGFRVTTTLGTVRCRILIVAAGAWSGEIAAMLGVTMPVLADVNMLSITEPAPPLLDRVVTHIGGILSLKQFPNGTSMIGGGWQGCGGLDSGRKDVDHENLLHNLRVAVRVVPALAALRLVRAWAGFEAVAPDALPVVGPLPGIAGAYVITGARGGYSQAPALASLLAELVGGEPPSLPLDRFDPGRLVR